MLKYFLLPIALLAIPLSLSAVDSRSQEQEYQQVRKIALRDPKVRAAYEEAEQRLEAKMVQIDPALKNYMKTRHVAQPAAADATKPASGTSKAPNTPMLSRKAKRLAPSRPTTASPSRH